jgi:multiple sugar transport system substrate-binding protein
LIPSPTPTPEPITINFAFPAPLDNYYDPLIAAFNEENPELTVKRKTARSPETWNYLFREGQVDAFVFLSEDDLFQNLYENGQVLNLTPLIQANDTVNLNDIFPSLLDPYTIEGKVWAIPGGANLGVLYYNKDLFDQYNVAYPQPGWTWSDLQMAAMAVRDPEAGIYGLTSSPFFVVPFVYQHGGRIVDDWRNPGRLVLDEPLTVEAVEWYASLIHDYDVMPSPEEAIRQFGNDGSPGYIFWRKKAGMYIGFYSDRGGEAWGPQAKWQMNWGMAPLPRDKHASTLGFVLAYAASSHTKYPDACWQWITYLSKQPPPFVSPARRSLAESTAFAEQVGAEAAAIARAAVEEALIVTNVQMAGLDQSADGFDEALQAIMNGKVDALQGLSDLQSRIDAQ